MPFTTDLQHEFIRDIVDMKPLVSLISEAKAEVVETVEDIDDSQKIKVQGEETRQGGKLEREGRGRLSGGAEGGRGGGI